MMKPKTNAAGCGWPADLRLGGVGGEENEVCAVLAEPDKPRQQLAPKLRHSCSILPRADTPPQLTMVSPTIDIALAKEVV